MSEIDLDELASGLSEFETKEKQQDRSPRDERIIAGFGEIQRFVDEHGRDPLPGRDKDIFERLYAVRLGRLKAQEDCRTLLKPLDRQGLLAVEDAVNEIDEDELLAELAGIAEEVGGITELTHVRPAAEKIAAEEVATRKHCEDFARFKPIFEQVQQELASGIRETRTFQMKAEIEKGRFFIVGGQKAYVAEKEADYINAHGKTDARLRVIFDNGTESNLLMRSLQRALNDDDAGRRITEPTAGPLFADNTIEGDEASGTIYVLRSKSDLPLIANNREVVHKIGVTNLSVKKRIAGARLQPTFLMADVEIVATFELYDLNRTKLENLIHRIFEPARLDIEIKDRFGNPVTPREWFLVPLPIIDEAVEHIKDGTIKNLIYDPEQARLVERNTV